MILYVYETENLQVLAIPFHCCFITACAAGRTRPGDKRGFEKEDPPEYRWCANQGRPGTRQNAATARRGGGDPVYTRFGPGSGVCGKGDRRERGESGGCSRESGTAEFLGYVVWAMPHGSSRPGRAAEEISGPAASDRIGG